MKFIKTKCGIDKYFVLKNKKGLFNKIRFYIFLITAFFVDLPKKR